MMNMIDMKVKDNQEIVEGIEIKEITIASQEQSQEVFQATLGQCHQGVNLNQLKIYEEVK